jgi:2-polyprenyl-3-methyl-5-hydroxy-6-metoxy-1,4-benzoquinol methylase
MIHNNTWDIKNDYDIVTLFHTPEHIPNQIDILKKISNILRPNGKIIIEIPHAKDFLLKNLKIKEYKDFTFNSSHLILYAENFLLPKIKFGK